VCVCVCVCVCTDNMSTLVNGWDVYTVQISALTLRGALINKMINKKNKKNTPKPRFVFECWGDIKEFSTDLHDGMCVCVCVCVMCVCDVCVCVCVWEGKHSYVCIVCVCCVCVCVCVCVRTKQNKTPLILLHTDIHTGIHTHTHTYCKLYI